MARGNIEARRSRRWASVLPMYAIDSFDAMRAYFIVIAFASIACREAYSIALAYLEWLKSLLFWCS